MSLNSALSIASGGLANINAQFALISQNVANASTPGYAAEVGNQQDVTAGGVALGVQTAPATLQINQALQTSVTQQNAIVSNAQTTQTALQAIDSVLGTPGSGSDIGSLLGNLQDSFSTLLTDPSNETEQSAVVSSAATLAQGINSLSAAYSAQRQTAQNDLGSAVSALNSNLATIGQLSDQIIGFKQTGQSTADLENQRNAAVQTLSHLINVNAVEQPDGDMAVFTSSGLSLPTRSTSGPFSIPTASTPPGSYYPGGGLPGINLGGQDVTSQMVGGQIGADITLRDTTLPTDQGELDEFAYGVSSRFASQGLSLFTDPSGNVPSGGGTPAQLGYVGFAATIRVNPAVTADPSLVRDGNVAIAGSVIGAAAFTPNPQAGPNGVPAAGPAGFTTLISNIVHYTFGAQVQSGVSQPSLNTNGLGASGNLTAPFNAGGALSDYATNLVASQAQQSATTTSNLTTDQALQSSLNAKISAVSGVNMDTEMSLMLNLQNAYGANARVINAVQTMFTDIMQAVQ
jgi:flagellar hook-associated protein 1 FlgK